MNRVTNDPTTPTTTRTTTDPTAFRPTRTLRLLLTVNGASNLAGGVVLLPLAGVLAAPTGLAPGVIDAVAAFYVVFGAAMWFTATRSRPRAAGLAAVISVNPLWALTCVLLLALAHPTTLGAVLLAAETATVVGLTAWELALLRRSQARSSADRPEGIA